MDPFTATILFFMWLALQPEHHHPPPDGHPKHDTCCGYKGCGRHQHYSGRSCGLPWEYDH
jgi:hypothetical protein